MAAPGNNCLCLCYCRYYGRGCHNVTSDLTEVTVIWAVTAWAGSGYKVTVKKVGYEDYFGIVE
ncbi:hypothetical protein J6590_046380 [Homalodisca vitripennis]|nr:hypothetical protein J6590_046380 [Homalodisca vitripennis]